MGGARKRVYFLLRVVSKANGRERRGPLSPWQRRRWQLPRLRAGSSLRTDLAEEIEKGRRTLADSVGETRTNHFVGDAKTKIQARKTESNVLGHSQHSTVKRSANNKERLAGPGLLHNLTRFLRAIVTIDCAALHYETDFLQNAYVRERVAGNGNNVGKIAWFKGADLILPTEKLGSIEEAALQNG